MITITQTPSKYTPSGNPIIFQLQSSHSNVSYFDVEVLEAGSGATISKQPIYPSPDDPIGSYVNLQRQLDNAVKWQISNTQNVMSFGLARPLLSYKLKITERGIVNGLMVELDPPSTTPNFFVWDASLDRITFHTFNSSDYVISTGVRSKFLTNKPNGSIVNDYSTEQLYFIHDAVNTLKAVVKTYNAAGMVLNTYFYSIPELSAYHMFSLQVSPKTLKESLLVDFTDVDFYTVHLEDYLAKKRSETRKYLYRRLPCHLEPTNMRWVNSLGGIDSYQFVNVQESNTITKNNFKKNIFKIDNGIYSDRTDDIWNAAEETISVSQQGAYVATSRVINDPESYWFNQLFTSKQSFVELNDASLVPVMVINNTYNVQRQKYTKGAPMTIQVNYTFSGDIIPHEATQPTMGFGNGSAQLDFIDKQMNSSSAFDTVLTFFTAINDGRQGVGGAVASTSSQLKFEFNKISPLIGLTQNMEINVGGVLVMVIDFLNDYTGKQFRFTDENGTTHLSNFLNGQINF